ncbi:hypothetical protein [Quadrisphaera sp. DSM 44207]|uniref:hypothetical protein n=1 Tax=Quadrisphaera sp. DSM 44207 TaxID=1881057 RepID=UPI000889AE97|nr:hypothetical protein [Quadrisphaera sp. DSM 44207]SDQ18701.1 hypothetical protein SAMN05428996_0989 [Quadrisphaera sp. DSM 44207]
MSEQDEHRGVTEEEIMRAMSVNSVPDEVRTHTTFRDETDQVMGMEGELQPAVDPHAPQDDSHPVQSPDGP